MSVVAGCSLFDGVLLTADCRATVQYPNQPDIHSDNVLKVFAIHSNTAIAFVGDINIADHLLAKLVVGLKNRSRKDPITLSDWLPRLFRHEYQKFVSQFGERTVIFMIASVIKGRPNVVERKPVEELVKYIALGHSPIQRNFIPNMLIEIMKLPSKYQWVTIPGTYMGVLYVLASPSFQMRAYRPLQFAAIGSGESAIEEITKYQDAILALEPGNSFVESSQFRQVIQRFIDERKIQSVGGLYPVLKVTGRGVEHITMGTEIPVGGTRIELAFENGRWIQKNLSTGKQIPILMPWELVKNRIKKDQTFNDLSEAYRHFKGEAY
jgi:hypothetical protein